VLCCAVHSVAEMGFNTWESWGCDISEEKIHAAADAMVAKGLKDAGCEERPP
jgi:alpha-galactosidase